MRLLLLIISMGAFEMYGQSFYRTYGISGRSEAGTTLFRASDGAIYLGGAVNDSALVQRIDENGTVLWSRKFRPSGQYPKVVVDLQGTPDGSIIGCGVGIGSSGSFMHEGFYFKLDPFGNFSWIRQWSNTNVYVKNIRAISPDEYLLFGCDYAMSSSPYADIIISRVDASNGDLTWVSPRMDLYNTVPYIDDVYGVAQLDDVFYTTGRVFTNGNSQATCRINVAKYNALGQHQWTRYLMYSNTTSSRMYGSDIIASNDSLTVFWLGNTSGTATSWRLGITRLDANGEIAWSKAYDVLGSGSELAEKIVATDFGYVVTGQYAIGSDRRMLLMAVDHSGNLLWTYNYGPQTQLQSMVWQYQKNLVALDDGFLFTGRVPGVNGFDLLLVRTGLDGILDCEEYESLNVTTADLPTTTFASPYGALNATYSLNSSLSFVAPTEVFSDCSSLTLDLGPDSTTCEAISLDASLPNANYQWQDGSTGASFIVNAAGTYWVLATVGCCIYSDTVQVEFGNGTIDIDLGPDTVLCSGSQLEVQLDTLYQDVLWQDGTTDALYVITSSGVYTVAASSGGCSAQGVIAVEFIDPPSIDLGPDSAICEGESIELLTGVSGVPHTWQDGSLGESLLVVGSGTYWVDVGAVGCMVSDTVMIDLLPAPVVDLGPDTLLCEGEQLLLQVDSGYAMYTWQDGSGLPSLSISGTGTYSVTVTDQGCTGLDSIEVVFVAPPLFDLGPNLAACEDDVLTLGTGLTGTPHLWQDGTTFDSLVVTVSGTYWVQVGAPGCQASDTVQVDFTPIPVLELGPDTTLCSGSELLLEVVLGQANITWQDGTSLPEYTITEGGTYWAVVEQLGCTANDTITVGFIDPPVVDLGPDLSVCAGEDTELGTGLQGLPHLWQDGTTAEVLQAVSSGTYWVVVGPTGCSGTDTVSLEVIPIPVVALGEDTLLCGSVQLVLTSGYPAVNTTWQDGSQAATFTVTGPGVYSVTVDVQGCTGYASIMVSVGELPYLSMPGDTLLCDASSVLLTAQAASGDVVIWQDGSSGPSYLAQGSGVFTASVGNACGTVSDSVRVSVAAPFMVPDRYLVCFGESARIDWADQVVSVAWSNGSVEVDLQLPEGGYTYTAVDASGCQREGAVLVYSDNEADGTSYIPNVFTPNGDGLNELFTVVGADRAGFSMEIFNRWGELLFETNDPDQGWNGQYDGSDAPDGTYIYVVQYSATCGERGSVNTIGHVTLLR